MLYSYAGHHPRIGAGVFVAPQATVLGRVTLGQDASIWHGAVLRGDVGFIEIGARSNIQDLSLVHVTTDRFNTQIGNDVTVGHHVVLHGCTVEHHCLVGMGAVIMDGAHIEPYCLIGAGALVTQGSRIPEGSLVMGSPARVTRALTTQERASIDRSAPHYVEIARRHRALVHPIDPLGE